MSTAIDPVLISRLSGEFETLGDQMWALGRDLELLRCQVASERADSAAGEPATGSSVPDAGLSAKHPVAGTPQPGVGRRQSGAGQVSPGVVEPSAGVGRARSTADEAGSDAVEHARPGVDQARSGDVEPSAGVEGARPGVAETQSGVAETQSGVDEARAGVEEAEAGAGRERSNADRPSSGRDHAQPGADRTPTAAGTSQPGATEPSRAPGSPGAPVPPDAPAFPGPGASQPQAGSAAHQGAVPGRGTFATPGPYGPQAGGYPYPAGRFAQPGGWAPRGTGIPYGVPPGGRGWGVPAGQAWRPPQAPKRTPWWQQEGVISRVLAVAGVGVTLIGVVMLLVLAAQAGFFGPVPRVAAGVAFSAALVGAGVRVYARSGGQVGGIALAATGIAGGYLNVVGVTTVYEWLPPVVGLALASAVAAGGVWLAVRWNSQTLAVLVVAGAAVLSPVLTVELALLGFLIVLQAACVPVQLARNWPILHVIRTAPAVLATLAAIAVATFDNPERARLYWLLTAAVAIAAVGLVGTVLAVRERSGDITATVTLAIAAIPLLAAPVMFERRTSVFAAAVFAAVLLGLAATAIAPNQRLRRFIPPHTAIAAAVAGSFALLEACLGVTDVQTLPVALLLVALGFLAVAGQLRNPVAAGIGVMFAALGALVFLDSASPETLAVQRFAEQQLDIATLLAALLALAVVPAGVWAVRRLPGIGGDIADVVLWVAASLCGLYAVTVATVSIGVASGASDGFLIGHSAATIAWMVAATAALLYGLRKLAGSPAVAKLALGSGLLVTAAALAKLFLFDLATLDGLVRVAAFLIVGVLLLLAGTRYARAFADASSENPPTS